MPNPTMLNKLLFLVVAQAVRLRTGQSRAFFRNLPGRQSTWSRPSISVACQRGLQETQTTKDDRLRHR